jgi:hypothetical protein
MVHYLMNLQRWLMIFSSFPAQKLQFLWGWFSSPLFCLHSLFFFDALLGTLLALLYGLGSFASIGNSLNSYKGS